MRILLVSNYYPEHIGGIETVAQNLARHYRRAGHTVRWCAAEPADQPHHGHPDDVPLPAWNGTERYVGFPYPIPRAGAYRTLVREIQRSDVVHVHDCLYVASALTCLAARLMKKPSLITQHVGMIPYRNPLLHWLQRAALLSLGRVVLSTANRVAFVSAEVRDWFSQFVRFRMVPELIENGVDLDLFKPTDVATRDRCRTGLGLPTAAPVILFVGRFVEKKGISLLRDAIAATPGWCWVLIGRPDGSNPAAWGLANARVLAPMSPVALRDYYAAADLLVLPSVGEGLPVVVQEAMACGAPVVVSEEVAAVIRDALPNLFITRRDGPNIVATIETALHQLSESAAIRIAVADFARSRWNWSIVGSHYESILQGLAGSGAPLEEVA